MAKLIQDFNQKNIKVKDGMINRRIDNGFNVVVDLFTGVLGDRCVETEKNFLDKRLVLEGFHYLKELNLKYVMENRLWERSFNLEVMSEVETDESFEEIGSCRFEVNTKGSFGIKSLTWKYVSGSIDEEQQVKYIERLSNPLITERIKAVDLNRVSVEHREDSGKWIIRFGSMIGSATWVLIPPVVQTIKPKPHECVKMLEFIDLVGDAVVNNRA